MVAAISVGILDGDPVSDLEYVEDSKADTDMNIVMTEAGKFIEIQGTAEGEAFSFDEMNSLVDMARHSIRELIDIQKKALA